MASDECPSDAPAACQKAVMGIYASRVMRIQIDPKSAGLGFAVGLLALLVVYAHQRNGRFLATMNSNGFIIVTDTQTGHVWVNNFGSVREAGQWNAPNTLPVKSAIWTPPDLLDQIAATNVFGQFTNANEK
jgi:hypothetical protein